MITFSLGWIAESKELLRPDNVSVRRIPQNAASPVAPPPVLSARETDPGRKLKLTWPRCRESDDEIGLQALAEVSYQKNNSFFFFFALYYNRASQVEEVIIMQTAESEFTSNPCLLSSFLPDSIQFHYQHYIGSCHGRGSPYNWGLERSVPALSTVSILKAIWGLLGAERFLSCVQQFGIRRCSVSAWFMLNINVQIASTPGGRGVPMNQIPAEAGVL